MAGGPPDTEDGDGSWLDRTNCALGSIGDAADLPADLTELYLTNNRIKRIENLSHCTRLRKLILRQNNISVVEGIDTLSDLVELDLYINVVDTIAPGAFDSCPRLSKLDLSFNELRTLTKLPCASLAALNELFLIANKLKVIENIHSMPLLTLLELGDNRIREISGVDAVPSLTSLWLGRNKIERIENLTNLPALRILSVQSNRITAIENIAHLGPHLHELYLSHNGIKSMAGIEDMVELRVLDLGANEISKLDALSALVNLVEFWINDNKLESFDDLDKLAGATHLNTVYLEGNPLAKDPDYASRALAALPPSLCQLDALPVDHVRAKLRQKVSEQ
jgi:protein phosphatase 1 regulatory subunit 7